MSLWFYEVIIPGVRIIRGWDRIKTRVLNSIVYKKEDLKYVVAFAAATCIKQVVRLEEITLLEKYDMIFFSNIDIKN